MNSIMMSSLTFCLSHLRIMNSITWRPTCYCPFVGFIWGFWGQEKLFWFGLVWFFAIALKFISHANSVSIFILTWCQPSSHIMAFWPTTPFLPLVLFNPYRLFFQYLNQLLQVNLSWLPFQCWCTGLSWIGIPLVQLGLVKSSHNPLG